MHTSTEISFEQLAAATMLEFIMSDFILITRYKKLFVERIEAYKSNELDAYTYVLRITTLAEEKLQ